MGLNTVRRASFRLFFLSAGISLDVFHRALLAGFPRRFAEAALFRSYCIRFSSSPSTARGKGGKILLKKTKISKPFPSVFSRFSCLSRFRNGFSRQGVGGVFRFLSSTILRGVLPPCLAFLSYPMSVGLPVPRQMSKISAQSRVSAWGTTEDSSRPFRISSIADVISGRKPFSRGWEWKLSTLPSLP